MEQIHLPRYQELPSIELYADQVIGYLNSNLEFFNTSEYDACITRTMINNYVKQGVITAPVKKKYNRDQLVHLLMISILKRSFSMTEIKELIEYSSSKMSLQQVFDIFVTEVERTIELMINRTNYSIDIDTASDSFLLVSSVKTVVAKLVIEKSLLEIFTKEDSPKKKKKH